MADNEILVKRIDAEDLKPTAVIATAFGCPFEGKVPMERTLELAEQFAAAGCREIGFGDTTGMAHPAYVFDIFSAAIERLPGVEITAHFHNTRGQGSPTPMPRCRPAARVSSPASASSAGARFRPDQPATSPPRT